MNKVWSRKKYLEPLKRFFRKYFPLLLTFWIFFVLYPNPSNLIISLQRISNPDINPGAVELFLEDDFSNPASIEWAVREKIPYSYDWEVHGMPWYFPTVKEVLEKERGDCKAKAIVLASILESKDIPYQFNCSIRHMWVEYEGKVENSIENSEIKFYQYDPKTGNISFQIPKIQWKKLINDFWEGFWKPMPNTRKALLSFGILGLMWFRMVLFKNKVKGSRK